MWETVWSSISVLLKIVKIEPDFVIVELDGTSGRLDLGKSLIDLQPTTISNSTALRMLK